MRATRLWSNIHHVRTRRRKIGKPNNLKVSESK